MLFIVAAVRFARDYQPAESQQEWNQRLCDRHEARTRQSFSASSLPMESSLPRERRKTEMLAGAEPRKLSSDFFRKLPLRPGSLEYEHSRAVQEPRRAGGPGPDKPLSVCRAPDGAVEADLEAGLGGEVEG